MKTLEMVRNISMICIAQLVKRKVLKGFDFSRLGMATGVLLRFR